MTRAIRHIGAWLTEAGISGAPMIPLFIYLTAFTSHEGSLFYVLPFVLFYAFNKTGDFILEMFGTLNNPYRLAQLGAIIVIVGAVLSLFGEFDILFYDAGASLVGFGTSVFGPMYRTLKENLQNEGRWPYGHPEKVGYPLMIVFVTIILFLQGSMEEIIIGFYVGLSVIVLLMLRTFPVDEAAKHEPLFDYSKHDYRKVVPVFFFLALVLFVRLFKQTASVLDILIVFVVATIVILVVVIRKGYAAREVFEYHSMFYNEMIIFVVLFDVFWYIGTGDITRALLVQDAMFLGLYLSMLFGGKILAHFSQWRTSNILILVTMAVSIVFLVDVTNFVGVFLVVFFAHLGQMRVGALYHQHRKLSLAALYLRSQEMINIGLVVGQTILVGVLAIVSTIFLGSGGQLMSAYAFRIPHDNLNHLFFLVQWIGLALLWIQGVALLLYEKRRQPSLFRYLPSDKTS